MVGRIPLVPTCGGGGGGDGGGAGGGGGSETPLRALDVNCYRQPGQHLYINININVIYLLARRRWMIGCINVSL